MFDELHPTNDNTLGLNLALPFMIETSAIKGRAIKLEKAIDAILTGHKYPLGVSTLLGEMIVFVSMLGSTLDIKESLTIQAQGDGAVNFITADYTKDGFVRGYAAFDEEDSDLLASPHPVLSDMLGKGNMVITIDHLLQERYQGIVPLSEKSLTDSLLTYFRQSDQLDAAIKIAVERHEDADGNKQWHAGGIMIQRIPQEGTKALKVVKDDAFNSDIEESWQHASILLQTVKDEELLSPDIMPQEMLYRLFHEDGVRIFPPMPLVAKCRCSREKMLGLLSMMSDEERSDIMEQGAVEVTCEFCNTTHVFTEEDFVADE